MLTPQFACQESIQLCRPASSAGGKGKRQHSTPTPTMRHCEPTNVGRRILASARPSSFGFTGRYKSRMCVGFCRIALESTAA
jgi:hypothetical protein